MGSPKPCLKEEFSYLVIEDVKLTSDLLGEGAYGEVTNAFWMGTPCAAKRLHRGSHRLLLRQQPTVVDKFLKECKTWSRLRHPNIVLFLGVVFEQESPLPVLIIEKMDTSLSNFIQDQPKEAFPLQRKVSVLLQVTLALCYLHSQNFIHRDLTPNNILLDLESFKAKITDFGVTGIINSNASYQTSAPGCPAFMPPEASGPEPKYNQKLDTFSFGNVLLFCSSTQWPNPKHPVQTLNGVTTVLTEFERRAAHVEKMSSEEKELFLPLIKRCLENEVEKRPSSRDLSDEFKKASSLLPQLQPSAELDGIISPALYGDNDVFRARSRDSGISLQLQSPTSSLKRGMEPTVSTVEEAEEFFQHNEAKANSLLFGEVMRLRSQLEAAQHSSTVCSECPARKSKEPSRQHISASTLPGRNMPSSTGQIVPRNKRSKSCGGPRPRDGRYWAEYQWSSSTPLPEKMFMASAVSVDKAIYIGGGYNISSQQYLTDIYKLDMDSGAWVIMPRRDPEHTTSGFAMAAHKGSLHVIGGEHNARLSRPVSDKVLTLDLSSPAGRWSSKSVQSLTTPRYISGATVHMDHLIVAGGRGEDDEPVPTLEVLSLEPRGKRRRWTVKMPLRCYARPQLLVHRSKILVGGDQRDNPEYMVIKTLPSSELFDYIKLSDRQRIRNELSWESNPRQRKGAALFTRNDELMAVGGLKQQAYCCLFNEASMVWENKLPKPDTIQARERAAAVPVGPKVYILGGKIESGAARPFVPSNKVDLLSVSY